MKTFDEGKIEEAGEDLPEDEGRHSGLADT